MEGLNHRPDGDTRDQSICGSIQRIQWLTPSGAMFELNVAPRQLLGLTQAEALPLEAPCTQSTGRCLLSFPSSGCPDLVVLVTSLIIFPHMQWLSK